MAVFWSRMEPLTWAVCCWSDAANAFSRERMTDRSCAAAFSASIRWAVVARFAASLMSLSRDRICDAKPLVYSLPALAPAAPADVPPLLNDLSNAVFAPLPAVVPKIWPMFSAMRRAVASSTASRMPRVIARSSSTQGILVVRWVWWLCPTHERPELGQLLLGQMGRGRRVHRVHRLSVHQWRGLHAEGVVDVAALGRVEGPPGLPSVLGREGDRDGEGVDHIETLQAEGVPRQQAAPVGIVPVLAEPLPCGQEGLVGMWLYAFSWILPWRATRFSMSMPSASVSAVTKSSRCVVSMWESTNLSRAVRSVVSSMLARNTTVPGAIFQVLPNALKVVLLGFFTTKSSGGTGVVRLVAAVRLAGGIGFSLGRVVALAMVLRHPKWAWMARAPVSPAVARCGKTSATISRRRATCDGCSRRASMM